MLTIRQLFYSLSGLYIVLLFSGLLLTRWFWFYPMELRNFLSQQQHELNSLSTAMDIRQEQLLANVNDYAHWTDTWNFIHGNDNGFTAGNFTPTSMATLKLDAVVILNNDRVIQLARRLDRERQTTYSMDAVFFRTILEHPAHSEVFNAQSGLDIVRINDTPYVMAVSPVMKTDHSGPQAGWLVFLQIIDQPFLDSLARITRLELREIPIPVRQKSALMPIELPIYEPSETHQRCFYNRYQEPALCLETSHDASNMPSFISAGTLAVLLILTLIPVAMFAALMHLLTEPIRKATLLLQRNNFDGLMRPVMFSTPIRLKELRQLRDAFNELVYTARQQQARLEQLSNTDRLTGIPNRRAFDEALENAWRRLGRHQQPMALILADIDYFKPFNDHYGHQAGDVALQKVAQALKSCARRTDEMAARFGGEEFAMILYVDNEQDMQNIRERIEQAISETLVTHGYSKVSKHLTISFGIAWIRESGSWLEEHSAEEWLHAADAALYAAKAAGRNCSMLQLISPQEPFKDQPEYRISLR